MPKEYDETIRKGQTLDLTYYISENENDIIYDDKITVDEDVLKNTDYRINEKLLWTPDENDVDETYTFEIGEKELSIKVIDVPDSVAYQWDARDDSSITQSNEEVTVWEDQVEGKELTGSASGLTDINGNQSLSFESGDSVFVSDVAVEPPWTLIIVQDASGSGERLLFGSDGAVPSSRIDGSDFQFNRAGQSITGGSEAAQLNSYIEPESGGTSVFRQEGSDIGTESDEGGETLNGFEIGGRSGSAIWEGGIAFAEIHDEELKGNELTDREDEIMDMFDISV